MSKYGYYCTNNNLAEVALTKIYTKQIQNFKCEAAFMKNHCLHIPFFTVVHNLSLLTFHRSHPLLSP